MATGERRIGSARRGMTVLGKIPAAPKPINLPSQRLENRGLDPNVEIVPRGTLSWGSTDRSPPTTGNAWGNTSVTTAGNTSVTSSGNTGVTPSPTVSTGPWNAAAKVQTGFFSGNRAGGLTENPPRPSSAGNGQRPSSAPVTAGGAWNGAVKSEEQVQASRFTLTPVDFPTLGSDKNPNLRPQQNSVSSARPASADGSSIDKERRLLTVPGSRQNVAALQYATGYGRVDPGPGSAPGPGPGSGPGPGLGPGGPGGYVHPGHGYSNYAQFVPQGVPSQGNHAIPMGPGLYPGPLHHDGYYSSPRAPHYGNMDDREMLMLGMVGNPGIFGHYPPHPGPQEHFGRPQVYGRYPPHAGPPEHVGRPGDGTLGAGSRPPGMNVVFSRERPEVMGYERDGHWGARQELGKHRDGWVSGNSRDGARFGMVRNVNDNAFPASVAGDGTSSDLQKHVTRTILGRHHPVQREWSAGNETLVSRPVFEEVVAPAAYEGPKCLNILLKDKSSQNQVPRTKLLSHENKGNLTSETKKSSEDVGDSGNGCTDDLLNTTASSNTNQNIKEIPSGGKEHENTSDLDALRETNKPVRVSEQVDGKKNPSVDIKKNSTSIKGIVTSLKTVSESEEEAASRPVMNFKGDLCGNIAANISDASITKVSPQRHGNSAVSASTPSLSSSLCSGTGSAVKISAPAGKSKMNHARSDGEGHKKSEKKPVKDASSDDRLSPVARVDIPKKNDKKVQRDASQDAENHNGAAHYQANSLKNTTTEDSDLRDDHKPKIRLSNHDGEKEWRPKLHPVDAKPIVKPAGNSMPPSRKADVPVSNSDTEVKASVEKRTSEQDSLQLVDSYDYEGQRAKLRETAAQRARQRQKEEEERSKEQKAKALAKLQELNRRTLVNANTEEAIVTSAENITSSSGTKEGAAAFRKKKQNRSVKSKQRVEGSMEPTSITEQITVASDLSSGDISGDGNNVKGSNKRTMSSESEGNSPAVETSPVQVSIYGFTMPDIGKNISFGSFHQDEYVELGLARSNDDGPTKKIQRKSHSIRRNFREWPVQEVRPVEKQHTTEGMVWAPVRTSAPPAITESESSNQIENNGEKVETDKCHDQTEKNQNASPHSSTLNKHAEIERHNANSTGKQQMQQQPAASSQQGHRHNQPREGSFLGEKAITVCAREIQHPPALPSTDAKVGIENRTNESTIPGRSHTLWRQRNSTESCNSKESSCNVTTEKEGNHLVPAVHEEDAVKLHSDVLKSSSAKSASQSGHVYKVKISGGQSTRTMPVLPSKQSNHHLDTKKTQLAPQYTDAEAQSTSIAVEVPSKETSHDMQTRQGSLPVRSNKAKLFRVQSRQGQAENESQSSSENLCSEPTTFTVKQDLAGRNPDREKRTFQEGQFNRRPRSAGANNPRQIATIDAKEQFTPSSGSQFNQKSGALGQSKAFPGATYREKEQHGSQPWQMPSPSQKAHHFGGKEPNLHNDLGKPRKPHLSVMQQDMKLQQPQEEAATGQAAPLPQQQSRASHMHKQGVDKEHFKEGGGSASHHQRKHVSGHLQWQQAAVASIQKSTPTLETTGPVHNNKEEISASKVGESGSRQETVEHSKPLSTKLRNSSENQKPSSHLQSEPGPETSQPFKRRDQQFEVMPEGGANSRQLDFGNGSYTKGRDNWQSRRGRFNGRFRPVNFDRKEDHLSKQRSVFDATGGACPSPVMG